MHATDGADSETIGWMSSFLSQPHLELGSWGNAQNEDGEAGFGGRWWAPSALYFLN